MIPNIPDWFAWLVCAYLITKTIEAVVSVLVDLDYLITED